MAFGSGLVNFCRITAGSFGASLVTTLWQRREAVHHTQLVEHITAYTPQVNAAINQLGHAGISSQQALAQMHGALMHQTTLLAANDIYWISGWLFALLVVAVWFAAKPSVSGPVAMH
jgi:DHA2 family multidrug resistance protein